MAKKSKRYLEAAEKVEKGKLYSLDDAIKLAQTTSSTKFDETVEVAFKLEIDTKQADQQIRGAIVLPNGTGKNQKVLVIAKGEAEAEAKEAGADFVGAEDYIQKMEKENWFDFDVMVTTPDMMPLVGKLGRVLGPKGLMPNPKTGTVTTDMKKAIEDIKAGKVTYNADKEGNIHLIIGKASFTKKDLVENFTTLYDLILKARPTSVKGIYMKNVAISTTMGPGIKLDLNSFDK